MTEPTSPEPTTPSATPTSQVTEPTTPPAETTTGEPPKPLLAEEPVAPAWEDHTLEAAREFFPEDVREHVSDESSAAFVEALNKHQIGKEGATALAELFTEQQKSWQAAAVEEFNAAQTAQQEAVKNDPEIGGDKLQQSLTHARTVLESYGDDKLLEQVNITGLGNNVEFIRFLNKVATAVPGEPSPPPNGQPTQQPKSLAQRLFPDMQE